MQSNLAKYFQHFVYTAVYINDRETLDSSVFILVQIDIIVVEKPEQVTSCETEWINIKLKGKIETIHWIILYEIKT
jgi:hypothetical protein